MRSDLLSPEDRLAFLLLQGYENCRKEIQFGYRVFSVVDESIVHTAVFKTFRTVAVWLQSKGFQIHWCEVNWRGYCSFVFKSLAPTIPQPGHLKNNLLFTKYLTSSASMSNAPIRDMDHMKRIYRRTILSDIKNDARILRSIGLGDLYASES